MTRSLIQTIVVGAGICGSTVARILHDKKSQVLVLDKSRGFGGRMATRRIGENQFNHGCPHIQGSRQFIHFLNGFLPPGFLSLGSHNSMSFAPAGMNSISKFILKDINVQLDTKVMHLQKTDDYWIVKSETGDSFECNTLILTAPLPQTLSLLDASRITYDPILRDIQYDPSLVLLIPGKDPTTQICSKEFSIENYELSDEDIFKKIQNENPNIHAPNGFQIKRWKYATPKLKHHTLFYKIDTLYLAGDSFGGPTLEGAFLSGLAAANDILGQTSK